MFNAEGTYNVTITQAILSNAQFCKDTGAFDICIEVKDDNGACDWCRKEWSNRPGQGNFADRQQWEITLQMLQDVGLKVQNGQELISMLGSDNNGAASIPALVGMKTTATIKSTVSKTNGKIYFNVSYLGGNGSKPEALDFNQFMQGLGMGGNQQQSQPQNQQGQQVQQQNLQPQQGQPQNGVPAFPGGGGNQQGNQQQQGQQAANGSFANLQNQGR